MKTLTIHAEEDFADAVRVAAAKSGQSINVFLTDIVGSTIGYCGRDGRKEPAFFKIEHPIEEDTYNELMSVQKDFSVIDEEMWK